MLDGLYEQKQAYKQYKSEYFVTPLTIKHKNQKNKKLQCHSIFTHQIQPVELVVVKEEEAHSHHHPPHHFLPLLSIPL